MFLKSSSTEVCLLALLTVLKGGLQAPTSYPAEEQELSSCPGYQSGNPGHRNMSGCETGTSLEAVDHIMAFGFNSTHNPDWNSCYLPELPEAK